MKLRIVELNTPIIEYGLLKRDFPKFIVEHFNELPPRGWYKVDPEDHEFCTLNDAKAFLEKILKQTYRPKVVYESSSQ